MRAGMFALGVAIVIAGGVCVAAGADLLHSAHHRETSIMGEEFAYVDGDEYGLGRALLVIGSAVGPQGLSFMRLGRTEHEPARRPHP